MYLFSTQRAFHRVLSSFPYVDRSFLGRIAFYVILLGRDWLAVLYTRQELKLDGTTRFHLYSFRRHLVNNRYHYYLIRIGQWYESRYESVLVIKPIDLNPNVKKRNAMNDNASSNQITLLLT